MQKINLIRNIVIGTIIIVVMLVVMMISSREEFVPSPQELFHEYYEDYPNLLDPVTEDEQEEVSSASRYYEQRDYDSAVQSEKTSDQIFYVALAYLQLDNETPAVNILENFVVDADHRFHEAMEWYLALAYLKIDELKKSEAALQPILSNADHEFHNEAIRLNRELPKVKIEIVPENQ